MFLWEIAAFGGRQITAVLHIRGREQELAHHLPGKLKISPA